MIELSNSSESEDTIIVNITWWQRRTRLEKKLLISFVFVAGVIISFLIDAALYWHKQRPLACESVECITASSDILNQIDEVVDPCNDFFKFTCGKLASRTHHEDAPRKSIKKQVKKQLNNILSEPINENDHPLLKYEKKLFSACTNEARNGTSLKSLKSLLNELGGWPVLMGEKWNGENFNLIDTIDKLKTIGLYHSMILQVHLKEKPPERNISVRSPILFSRNDKDLSVYHKIMVDQAIALGAEGSVANEEMSRVFDFMVKISNLNSLAKNETDNGTRRLSVFDLQQNYKGIDWLRYLKVVLEPLDTVSENDYVVFPYSNFLQNFFNLINATNNKTLANYILWTASVSVMSLVSNDLLDLHNQLRCVKEGSSKDRTEECQNFITHIMHPNPSFFSFVNRHTPKSTREIVREMFNLILKEFQKLIAINTWMDRDTKNKANKWLKKVDPIIGFKSETVDNIYETTYKPLNDNDAFLTSYLKLKKEKFLQESIERKTKNYSNWGYYQISETEIFYFKEDRTILLPAGMLQGIYFDENRPMFINYGVLGKCIGSVLVYTYIHSGSKNDSELWSKEMQEIYENKTSCISHNSEYFGDEGNVFGSSKYQEKQYKIAQIMGIKLAYNAYNTWINENGKELNLVGLNYTDSQIFWVSSLADVCFQESYDTENNFYSDSEIVRQNFDFANDFQCDVNSKMNPSNKCIVFYSIMISS